MRRLIAAAGLLLAALATPASAIPLPFHGTPYPGVYAAGTAFAYKNGVFTILGSSNLFGSGGGFMYAMNNNGIAVGSAGLPFQGEGLIYDTNTGIETLYAVPMGSFGLPTSPTWPAYTTWFTGINDAGDIAGFTAPANYSPGLTAISLIGGVLGTAGISGPTNIGLLGPAAPDFDITNPHVRTITTASLANGTAVGYLLVPEPSPLWLMLTALMMLTAWCGVTRLRPRASTRS